jgi:uncharacterized protein (TIGR02231 family)
MQRMRTAGIFTALVAVNAAAAPGTSLDLGGSRIERVTVYPGMAQVERSAKVSAGARELVLDCLSPSFDMASLQIDGADGVKLGPVSALTRPRSEVPACDVTPLDERIRQLEDRIAAVQAESDGHDLALGYLRGLGAPESASAPMRVSAAAPHAAGVAPLVGSIQRSGQEAYRQQNRLARERQTLERELQPLAAERERLRGQGGEVRQLRIALWATRDSALTLRYQVAGPSWGPSYRATLDTSTPPGRATSVLVERLAQVSQRTGEDWKGVRLTLSTGSPTSATAGPDPRPWHVRPRPPVEAERAMPVMALAAPPAPAPLVARSRKAERAVEEAEPDFTVQQVNNEFATQFELPHSVDVHSGGQRVSVALDTQRLPATLRVQTVPQQEASAWWVADIQRPAGIWPEGPLQLLRGTQAVGRTTWRNGDQERIDLPFGRDEGVRVRVLPSPPRTASGGFIGSRQERQETRVYEIENRHRTPIDLQVLEASPVAQDERISVTAQFTPEPQERAWRQQPGIVAWRRTLEPAQTARFSADYQVSHPKDVQIQDIR